MDVVERIPLDLARNRRFFDDITTVNSGNGAPPIVDMGAYEFGAGTCIEMDQAEGSVFATGTTVTLSGRAVALGGAVVMVVVDGQEADALDAAGRFFHRVNIDEGQNCFGIAALDGSGIECEKERL
jgi:hypothetical protein